MLYGALEAGGTKMVCALGDENGTILEQTSIPTTMPDETLSAIIGWFRDKEIASLGVACFGPVDLRRSSPTYGYITTTPKKGWAHVDIVGILKRALGVPVGFDTDELADLDHYIVPASLHDDQGIMGAIKLAIDATA